MTIDIHLSEYTYDIKDKATYESLYNPEEFDKMVALCKRTFKRDYTNGASVRLDGCMAASDKTIITVSPVWFYDFLTSNFALFQINKLKKEADAGETVLVERLQDRFNQDGAVTETGSLFSRKYLANPLAVSCLIRDKTGRFLMTKRNGTVGISNNFYSTTVTGSVDFDDLKGGDPLVNCCVREVNEELGYVLDPAKVKMHTISVGVRKLQPIALADILVSDLDEVYMAAKEHPGFNEESNQCYMASPDELRTFLRDENALITEAARTHLESAVGQ